MFNSGASVDKDLFRNPSAQYRSVPFWAWNGDLQEDETRRQVRELADKGIGGGFIHSRAGLRTRYLGPEWFANCEAAIDEASKVGIHCWLYDEDRWPSGSCGGATAAQNPEYRARQLIMERRNGSAPSVIPATDKSLYAEAECLARFRVSPTSSGTLAFTPLDTDATAPDTVAIYAAVCPPCPWENGGYYPDLLHPGATQEFIRNTYEEYARRFQGRFGKEVPGIFTDEPELWRYLPWSVVLREAFLRRRGYDLIPRLPALYFSTQDASEIRHDYWKTIYELFRENYMGQLGEWCRAHGLSLTGHLNGEDSLWWQILSSGGAMAHYLTMQIPGVDILRERITETLTCKQTASICRQFGKPVMLSETYGGIGYDLTFEGQKWVGDWQMALGVNFICQHLTHYTIKGMGKRDYPPSFSYQSPWWRHYRHLADYQARLCYALRQGTPMCDILLLHPLTGAWCRLDPVEGRENRFGLGEMEDRFDEIMRDLLSLHRDFDLGDELVMAEHGRVVGDELQVGVARYKLVIVPPTCNIESSTLDLLERYVAAGGKLMWLRETGDRLAGRPETTPLVNGRMDTRVESLLRHEHVHCPAAAQRDLADALDALLPRRVSIVNSDTDQEAANVFCQQRAVEGGFTFFLANTDREARVPLCIRVPVSGTWELWNAETGEIAALPYHSTAAGSELSLALAPVGSVLLRMALREPTQRSSPPPNLKRRERVLNPRGRWRFRRLAPNSLALDRCSYRIGEEQFSEEMFLAEAQEAWRKRFGLSPLRTIHGDVQLWKKLENPANLRTLAPLSLQYRLRVKKLPPGSVDLVLEDRDKCDVFVNGTPVEEAASGWFLDKSFERIPIKKFLKRGDNAIEVRTALTPMRVVEDVYVVGDFGVDSETFTLTREPRFLALGDWCPQGYPFYTDGMIYQTAFRLSGRPAGRVYVELQQFQGTVAAIWVNDRKAAGIGWRPYRAEVTPHIVPGLNRLGIEVVGSSRNLMGPRHTPEKYPAYIDPTRFADTTQAGYHRTPAGLHRTVKLVRTRFEGLP